MIRAAKILAAGLAGLILLLAAATAIGDVLIGWANPPIGEFIDTAAGRQHVLDVRPDADATSEAPAVVLLHGAGSNLGDMRVALLERLRDRYRVIAVDRPGHGWSERTGGAAGAPPRRQAEVLHEILGKLGAERPLLLAHSWAGAVALAYALDYPDAVRGLVLLAPVALPLEDDLLDYAGLVATPWFGAVFAYTLALPVGALGLDRILTRAFAPQTPPARYIARASICLALRPETFIANAQDLAVLGPSTAALAPRYSRIATPTIIITGTRDHMLPARKQARALAEQLPKARLIVLPGVGHMLHHVEPQRVIAAVDALAPVGYRGAADVPPVKPLP